MEVGKKPINLHCHSFTLNSPEADFKALLELSGNVFDPDYQRTTERQGHPATWKEKLNIPGALLIYATGPDFQSKSTTETASDESVAKSSPAPLGFFFAYPLKQPEIGHETMHLWLAGVHPEARGRGIFPFLMERLKVHAKETCGLGVLSVCTYPNRFEQMYRIIRENKWEDVAWRDGGEKILMKLAI